MATPALTVVAPGANLVAQFVTPIAVNAITPTRLIIGGGNSVYESTDQGATITEIGPGMVVNSQVRTPSPTAVRATLTCFTLALAIKSASAAQLRRRTHGVCHLSRCGHW